MKFTTPISNIKMINLSFIQNTCQISLSQARNFLSPLFTFFLKLFRCCKTLSSVKPIITLIGKTISPEVQNLLSSMTENKVSKEALFSQILGSFFS